ncbi:MAG: class I adenylate-forming enzyme family protein [bacterium]
MIDSIRRIAQENPDALALDDGENSWTYRELDDAVEERASQLLDLGAGPGITIALASEVDALAVQYVHAVFRTGSTIAPVNPRLGLQGAAIEKLNPQIVLLSKQDGPTLDWYFGKYEHRYDSVNLTGQARGWTIKSSDLSRSRCIKSEKTCEFPAALLSTSGTDGASKIVPIMHQSLDHSAGSVKLRLGLSTEDRWYASLSLAHIGGLALIHRSAWTGSALLVKGYFSIHNLVDMIDSYGISHTSLVPTMLYQLLESRDEKPIPATLKALIIGGAPMSSSLLTRALAAGYPVASTYGMTETCSQVATASVELVKQKPGTVGAPIESVEVKIAEDQEIWVRGPTVIGNMSHEGSWFATGDLGKLDEEGHLWVIGRQRDIIITGGVNVDPLKIAEEIRSIPGVYDAAVIGFPDAVWGEVVGALVVTQSGESLDKAIILEALKGSLSKSEVPRLLSYAPEIPMNTNGKINRKAILEILDGSRI